MELTGNNLGKRQQELNIKVQEAFNNQIIFDDVKHAEEKSDLDRLFKIDLAIAYKNIDYIVDTLKCGDSLYISRALKCSWLYKDEFKHIINPDYLQQNIFPLMSTKMKKKTLAAIASNTKNEDSAYSFYTYCLSAQMNNIAWDFLLKTSETIKKEYLSSQVYIDDSVKFEQFFGNSFDLIEFYLKRKKATKQNVEKDIFNFRYLFSFSANKYCDLLELHTELTTLYTYHNQNERFGGRMSKNIMVNYKERVLEKPWLYLRKLNVKIIIKYSSSNDAKIYLEALLPDTANRFWSMNYYSTYKDFIQLLPANEVYLFLKHIFTTNYPNELFEMDDQFFRLQYYDLLSADERNAWALKHLEQKKEILGPGQDFIWYKFVKFELAFPAIKKCIFVTTCQNKRAEMIRVLIHAASNQEDLEQLLNHYYERHVNEDRHNKKTFIDEVIQFHNVFKFNDKCWKPVYKLLHSLKVFTIRQYTDKYTILAMLYNILHTNEIPEVVESQWESIFAGDSYLFSMYYKNLEPDQHQMVYHWFIKYFEDKINVSMKRSCENNKVKNSVVSIIRKVLTLMDGYEKCKDDCPVLIMDCMKLYWNEFCDYKWFQVEEEVMSEGLLLRLLKKDQMLLINKFPDIKASPTYVKVKKLLRKIKIYFSNDLAKSFQTFFEECLADNGENLIDRRLLYQSIFGLFCLTDEDYKINFMSRHAPTEAKIQHDKIDSKLLQMQEAICRFACYSRPPVPLSKMLEYIKGDYIHFCIPMFGTYLANLPTPQSMKFIEAILNAPVSIQKHGLRLAFISYDPENLKQLVLDIWKKTKNISLRAVIYKALFDKIKKDNEVAQSKLYPVLKILTVDLHEDDQDDIFELLASSALPCRFNGDYLETSWIMVRKLQELSSINVSRKAKVMSSLGSHIEQIDREFCRSQVIDEHIQTQFSDKQILHVNNDYGICDLIDEKWDLAAKYITHFGEDELNSSLEVLQLIMDKCLEMWNEVYDNKYVVREFLTDFIRNLRYCTDYRKDRERKPYIVPVFELILDFIKNSWPLEESYTITWEFKLLILGVTSIGIGKYNPDKNAITYDHLSSTEVAENFAKEIIDVIKDLLSKNQFYYSFYSTIEKAVIDTIHLMTPWTDLDQSLLTGQVSLALTKYSLYEANMLALRILSVPKSWYWASFYSDVIQAIKDYDHFELNAFMYHKFVYPDFGKRL